MYRAGTSACASVRWKMSAGWKSAARDPATASALARVMIENEVNAAGSMRTAAISMGSAPAALERICATVSGRGTRARGLISPPLEPRLRDWRRRPQH